MSFKYFFTNKGKMGFPFQIFILFRCKWKYCLNIYKLMLITLMCSQWFAKYFSKIFFSSQSTYVCTIWKKFHLIWSVYGYMFTAFITTIWDLLKYILDIYWYVLWLNITQNKNVVGLVSLVVNALLQS